MMDYQSFFASALDRLQTERRYRVFADIERLAGRFPQAIWHSPEGARPITVWCSNDYLGMGQNRDVTRAMVEFYAPWRFSTPGTVNCSAYSPTCTTALATFPSNVIASSGDGPPPDTFPPMPCAASSTGGFAPFPLPSPLLLIS